MDVIERMDIAAATGVAVEVVIDERGMSGTITITTGRGAETMATAKKDQDGENAAEAGMSVSATGTEVETPSTVMKFATESGAGNGTVRGGKRHAEIAATVRGERKTERGTIMK